MGLKTKFINCSSSEVRISEANSGVRNPLFTLGKKDGANSSKEVKVDTNATYKEYHVFQIPSDGGAITVSSDDLQENKEVRIMEVPGKPGVFKWIGTLRKPLKDNKSAEAESSKQDEGTKSSFKRLTSYFWSRKPAIDEGSSS
ncbi:hypothetical protein M758_7G069700 [Ceratodon purpureus]|nr:hypothetical protein M758_7G069700 [Ceratodon purpureus]